MAPIAVGDVIPEGTLAYFDEEDQLQSVSVLSLAKGKKAWAKTYPENKHVKFLADGSAKYTNALGLELDLAEMGLGILSRRYALLIDDLQVKVANVESGGEFTVSGADDILSSLQISACSCSGFSCAARFN
ncbi:peroxiredoxin-2b [Nicotiana attenuata]|uniref:glutaredoxin-dependent peroxiredoxin n=1 Tax=Nicotiana attenuata TaxID=49451 RepID=A0A314L0F9_NICAT|nr:peroxiredoxin-2b [Nicotiana attenuata]